MTKKLFIYFAVLFFALVPAVSAEVVQAQYKFEGSWLPELDPAEIGPTNFQTLQNLRYGEQHPEGISGYTEINTTPLATYTNLDAGIQLRTEETNKSYVIVHSENSGGTGRIYTNTTSIPSQGDFGTYIHEDASGAGLPMFSKASQGNVIYANGAETYIYSGNRYRVAKLYLCDDSALANPRDYTEAANDTLETTGHKFTVAAATTDYFVIFTNRPAQGFYFDVASVNATASTLTANVYTSAGWAAVSSASDGTADGGVALAQDGYYGFTSTVSNAVRFHFEGLYLYAYRFVLSAGSADIGNVKADLPWQELNNNWDGVPRSPILFAVGITGDPDENYTVNVQEPSNLSYPNGAVLDGMTHSSGGYIVAIFEDRMAGIRLDFLGEYLNAAASTTDTYYWDGDSWVNTSDTDGTSGFTESGLISWVPPAESAEFPYTYMNVTGYAYKIDVVGADVTNAGADDEVIVDYCNGIPAPEDVGPFAFTVNHKGRLFGASLSQEAQYNRVDYTPAAFPDVWNGTESSDNGKQSLYFGGAEKLTGGASLYNRYGSNIFSVLVLFKYSEMYQLKGNGPEEFEIDVVSENIGCPAPLTIANAEIGFEVQAEAKRNIIMWVSTSGPMAYDGAVLYPINGIDNYFDPNEAECFNWAYADIARGWYDPIYREYNLLFPSGSGQTTINKWLVYDLERKSWFEKYTGSAEMPICGFQVADTDGGQYVYGGLNDGSMMRLDNGTSWNGTGIDYKLVTGDFWPNNNNVWHQTRIRRIKLIAKKLTTDHSVEIVYRKDTDAEAGISGIWRDTDDVTWTDDDVLWASSSLLTMSLYSEGGARLIRDTKPKNLLGWSHSVGFQMTTSDTAKAFEPIGWGIEYEVVRDDH